MVRWLVERGADVQVGDTVGTTPLMAACRIGRRDMVEYLLEHDADPFSGGWSWIDSPLWVAAQGGFYELAQWILDRGGAAASDRPWAGFPLYDAARSGNMGTVRWLASRGALIYSATVGCACKWGCIDTLRCLLEAMARKPPTTGVDSSGDPPLIVACEHGNAIAARLLLAHGADANAGRWGCGGALHIACTSGDKILAQLLVEHGACVTSPNAYGISPLMAACTSGHWAVAMWLISHGGAPDWVRREGADALRAACWQGNIEIATWLAEHGAEVIEIEDSLLSAVESDDIAVARWLLERGVRTGVTRSGAETPLHIACQRGNLGVVELLVENGANVNRTDGDRTTPLWMACKAGQTEVAVIACEKDCAEIAELLVESGADLDQVEKNGRTPLHAASGRGRLEVVKLLISHGAALDGADRHGATPLWTACKAKHEGVARWLGEQGADINIQPPGRDGETPLWLACSHGLTDFAMWLVDCGADVDRADKRGRTPLLIACAMGHLETAKWLTEQGAAIDRPDDGGRTPLWMASQRGSSEMVAWLAEHGADVNRACEDGTTPLAIASAQSAAKTVELLIKNGADVGRGSPMAAALESLSNRWDTRIVPILEILVDHGARDFGDDDDEPLIVAAVNRVLPRAVDLLLRHGAAPIGSRARDALAASPISIEHGDIEKSRITPKTVILAAIVRHNVALPHAQLLYCDIYEIGCMAVARALAANTRISNLVLDVGNWDHVNPDQFIRLLAVASRSVSLASIVIRSWLREEKSAGTAARTRFMNLLHERRADISQGVVPISIVMQEGKECHHSQVFQTPTEMLARNRRRASTALFAAGEHVRVQGDDRDWRVAESAPAGVGTVKLRAVDALLGECSTAESTGTTLAVPKWKLVHVDGRSSLTDESY